MKESSTDAHQKRTPHVPGSFLGYSLQQTLFVSLLLQSRKESIVSLEVFEDIGVETPGEGKLAVQSKSTSNGNPVSDRSIDC